MARRVQEVFLSPVHLTLVCTDVLGYPARLCCSHVRLANGVKQRRFAVIYMAHDGYYWRPGFQTFRRILYFSNNKFAFFSLGSKLCLKSELCCQYLGYFSVDFVIDANHDAQPCLL